jgi:hypothetical protein
MRPRIDDNARLEPNAMRSAIPGLPPQSPRTTAYVSRIAVRTDDRIVIVPTT